MSNRWKIVQHVRSFEAHRQDSPMAPKVKTTTQSLESMEATQADSPAEKPPEEELETQCAPLPDAPDEHPKKKRGRPRGKGTSTTSSRRTASVKNVISKNILVHPKIVQQVLNELENVCVETVKTKGVFRMRFFAVRLREARDARRTIEILPGKNLKQVCK